MKTQMSYTRKSPTEISNCSVTIKTGGWLSDARKKIIATGNSKLSSVSSNVTNVKTECLPTRGFQLQTASKFLDIGLSQFYQLSSTIIGYIEGTPIVQFSYQVKNTFSIQNITSICWAIYENLILHP